MKRICALILPVVVLLCAVPAGAQQHVPFSDGEILPEAQCFKVINQAMEPVSGTVITNKYKSKEGVMARHRSNFKLGVNEMKEFCTYGPFYEGRKLALVLRTSVPVFNCKTAITGPIILRGVRTPEKGFKPRAGCL